MAIKEIADQFIRMPLAEKINAMTSHLRVQPANVLHLTSKWDTQSTVNSTINSYFRAQAHKAVGDDVTAGREVIKILASSTGLSPTTDFSFVPRSNGLGVDVRLPIDFFSKFPEHKALAESHWRNQSTLLERSEPVFRIRGAAFSEKPILKISNDAFDYWPPILKRGKLEHTDELKEFNRREIAETIFNSILAKTLTKELPLVEMRGTRVVTFGSCFAVNLNRALQSRGVHSESLRIEESVNTTHANRLLIESILEEKLADELKELVSSKDLPRLRQLLLSASMIVLTVGVSPVNEWVSNGKLCLVDKYKPLFEAGLIRQRFTSVAENKENIVAIAQAIRRYNSSAQIFLTLSPVPLLGVADGSSVFVGDAISKSTLRLAVEQASSEADFVYWPSFEVVKWVSPHIPAELGYQAYAEDDNNSRHVSGWLIEVIVDKFVELVFQKCAE